MQVSSLSQFDLMMQLAQKKDGVARIFDVAEHKPIANPGNNFLLFDQVDIKNGEVTSDAASNASKTVTGEEKPVVEASQQKVTALMVKDRLKGLQKVWAAMTKLIASQCANGRTVDLPLAGKFRKMTSADDSSTPKYMFMPHLDFVGSGHFRFSENASNVSPFSTGSKGFGS